ncbi:MAG TPA: menaquinone biosynthesis protein [Longimicrobiaceae bacterium]|nr:menaquinone biosynthesis protein [Longimicrobiaceae bacterium]
MQEEGPDGALRLGDIVYSNCFPVHARLIDRPEPGDPALIRGIPSYLNGLLERGEIDVSPSSSIEYARHAERYRILPELVIGSRGPVRSILFLCDREPKELAGRRVALPTASATSVVLLKVLLRVRWGVRAEFFWFDQAKEDPFARGASAALFIGDVALRPDLFPTIPLRFDLGEEWWRETGLPFAFAVWQAASGPPAALGALQRKLVESRAYAAENRAALAERYAAHFGLPAALLDDYWATLTYDLDAAVIEGLQCYYRLAAELGELPRAPELRWA